MLLLNYYGVESEPVTVQRPSGLDHVIFVILTRANNKVSRTKTKPSSEAKARSCESQAAIPGVGRTQFARPG